MGIISFEKPNKLLPTELHNNTYISECLPPGGFVPNMSKEDVMKWKGKISGKKTGILQLEVRKNGLLLIIGEGKIKRNGREYNDDFSISISGGSFSGKNKDLDELFEVVEEGRKILKKIRETLRD